MHTATDPRYLPTGPVTSLHPGGPCDPCERDLHHKCIGWDDRGFCGCARGLCLLRLVTRVMWDIHDGPNGQGEP